MKKNVKIVFALLSALVIIAMLCVLVVVEPSQGSVDTRDGGTASQLHTVTQHTITAYCPSRMSLADSGSYGDSQYQTSAGNIVSHSAHAAFGAVYDSSISAFPNAAGTATSTQLQDKDPTDDAAVSIAQSDVNANSLLHNTQLLDTANGAGAASSVVSQASTGDLRGLSASSCVNSALSQSFLLPATATGWTQQLVIANTTDKATAVSLNVWGTSSAGTLALRTARTISIAAGQESQYNLAAAAPGQDGLFVTVSSKDTAVSAVVKVVGLNGLKTLGSDYVTASDTASQSLVLPGVTKAERVQLLAFAEQKTSMHVSWITNNGLKGSQSQVLAAHRVSSIDLGTAPDDALGVSVSADNAVHASAIATASGTDGQQDFGVITAQTTPQYSSIAVPQDVGGSLIVANRTTRASSMELKSYDANGSSLVTTTIKVGPNAATNLALTDLGTHVAAITMQQTGSDKNAISWSLALTDDGLQKAKLAGVSYLQPVSLMLQHASIRVNETVGVLR